MNIIICVSYEKEKGEELEEIPEESIRWTEEGGTRMWSTSIIISPNHSQTKKKKNTLYRVLGLFNMAKPNRTEPNQTEIDNMVWI